MIEDKTRTLSPTERIIHLILSMTGGAYVALLLPVLLEWSRLVTALISVEYGFRSWILSILGIGVFVWGLRDLWSGLALEKRKSKTSAVEASEVALLEHVLSRNTATQEL